MNFKAFNLGVPRPWLPPKLLLIMKLIIVIMTTFLLQVSAAGFAQRITIVRNNISLSEVFKEIRKQTGYNVLWQSDQINAAERLNVKVQNRELKDALDQILKSRQLNYTIEEETVTVKAAEKSVLDNVIARFQTIDVRGRIFDGNDQPLSGATISVKGTNQGTKTDAQGNFYLANVDEKAVLLISFVGFKPREVVANADVGILVLEMEDKSLKEVIIVNKGYYNTPDEINTGSVGTLKGSEIEKQNVNNPILALQGRIAGVQINQVNGIVGGQMSINIRGLNTFTQGRSPLYIIDGVPFSPSMFSTPGFAGLNNVLGGSDDGQNLGPNPLSLINPTDIESIDVLKVRGGGKYVVQGSGFSRSQNCLVTVNVSEG